MLVVCPSVCLSILLIILDAIDFGPSVKINMAAMELFKNYAIDTPCERYIFKTVSPIDFKFEIYSHIIHRTNAIDFGPSAKNKMTVIVI